MFWASTTPASAQQQTQQPATRVESHRCEEGQETRVACRLTLHRAHIFSTSHMHVHFSQHVVSVVESAMDLPIRNFKVSLYSLEERSADNVLVSVSSVVRMAKIMATFASMQTIYTDPETAPLVLAYEVGRTEHALRPRDKIIIFTDNRAVHRHFFNVASVLCIDLAQHHESILTRENQTR